MVNLGLIGIGSWGSNLLRTLERIPSARLAGLCDSDAARLARAADLHPEAKTSTRPADLFRDPTIRAVVIAVPASRHYRVARAALLAGKDVYVEKPMATLYRDGAELVRLARARKRILMVGHILEYHPAVVRLQQAVRRGELGRISYIYSTRVNLGSVRTEENALWSLATHDISVIISLLGGEVPRTVQAVGAAYLQKRVEDVVFLTLGFPHGVLANIHVSWLDPHKVRKLTVVGTKKMAVFDDIEPQEKIKIFDKGILRVPGQLAYGDHLAIRTGDILSPKVEMEEPLAVECRHFLECVERRRAPLTDGREGLKVLRVLEAAQRSLRHGSRVIRVG